jgi:hypothetical protein
MFQDPQLQDANVSASSNLPSGAATVTSTFIDLQNSTPAASFVGDRMEFQLQIPALSATLLPNADTITYTIVSSPDNGTTIVPEFIVPLTGIGGSVGATGGIAAVNYNFRVRMGVNRYLGFQATGVSGVAASTAVANLVALF